MATINLQVSASGNDTWQAADTTINAVDVTARLSTGNQWGLFYFPSTGLPVGATLSAADLQIYVNSTTWDDPNVDIYVEDVDSAAAPTTTNADISNRTLTTAKTNWSGTAVGSGFKTISILTAVQEWADRPGRTSTSNLAVILDCLAGSDVRYDTYDGTPANAAKLDLTYTVASSQPVRSIHQFRLRRGL